MDLNCVITDVVKYLCFVLENKEVDMLSVGCVCCLSFGEVFNECGIQPL